MPFDTPPSKPSIPVKAWKPHVPQEAIDDLKARLAASAPRARTWDNTNGPDHLGIKRTWIDDAIVYWKDKYDWSVCALQVVVDCADCGVGARRSRRLQSFRLSRALPSSKAILMTFTFWPSTLSARTPCRLFSATAGLVSSFSLSSPIILTCHRLGARVHPNAEASQEDLHPSKPAVPHPGSRARGLWLLVASPA